jgi:hypothetical protein
MYVIITNTRQNEGAAMAEKTTYIKLDRNIEHWRWWKTRNTLQVFIWLLLHANTADRDFENETIKRGELATSLKSIANSCFLTIDEVRTALGHLKSTGEITSRKRPHYQVITIVSYSKYQEIPGKTPSKSQADPKQIPCKSQQYKNYKNYKNEKNIYKGRSAPRIHPSGDTPTPTASRMKPPEEGTVDDIPPEYRDRCKTYAEYWEVKNQ